MRMMHTSLLLTAALAVTSSLGAQNVALVAGHLYTMDAGCRADRGWCSSAMARSTRCGRARIATTAGLSGDPWGVRYSRADRRGYDHGISGAYNISADQDQEEATDPNTADVNVRDSLNPEDLLYQYVNTYGVTTLQVAPGPGTPSLGVQVSSRPPGLSLPSGQRIN